MDKARELISRLERTHSLALSEYQYLIDSLSPGLLLYARERAERVRKEYYSNDVFIRGLIEISNVCKNDCYYCGIRHSNKSCQRYRLTKDEILSSCKVAYSLGIRTFVLQGGEGGSLLVQEICDIVSSIKELYPDTRVTLSLGEYTEEEYRKMRQSGADRYLLRHESADSEHYGMLHPKNMSLEGRLNAIRSLKKLGFYTGIGMMVGSPYQTSEHLAKDLKLIEELSPEMCGIGPFIPHKDTPFGNFGAGSVDLTLFLISLIRLIKPNILLPATTALGTLMDGGREMGILHGANVVMPNVSPIYVRDKYALYNNKLATGAESAEGLLSLEKSLNKIGYKIAYTVGDLNERAKG